VRELENGQKMAGKSDPGIKKGRGGNYRRHSAGVDSCIALGWRFESDLASGLASVSAFGIYVSFCGVYIAGGELEMI
jgi:hypothetical protein